MAYTAYLINPENETVEQLTLESGLQPIYTALDVDLIEAVYPEEPAPEGTCVYVDEEGLFRKSGTPSFTLTNYPHQPLFGRGLVVGTDGEGETVSPSVSLEEVRSWVRFPRRWFTA